MVNGHIEGLNGAGVPQAVNNPFGDMIDKSFDEIVQLNGHVINGKAGFPGHGMAPFTFPIS
jgi:hypothetical protein